MANRIFDKKNVILLKVNEEDLISFLVDMDIDDAFLSVICLASRLAQRTSEVFHELSPTV